MIPDKPLLVRKPSFSADLLHFMVHNRKWWLYPIVAVLAIMGVLIILGQIRS